MFVIHNKDCFVRYLYLFFLCIISLGLENLQAEIKYHVVEVPLVDNKTAIATHINENGLLVGQAATENEFGEKEGLTIGFIWNSRTGEQTILRNKDHDVAITGMNDHDEVIGYVVEDAYWNLGYGFIWNAEKGMQFLKKGEFQYACPVSINNLGQIIGLRSSLKLGDDITLWEGKNVKSLEKEITKGLNASWRPIPSFINDKSQILFLYKFDKEDWLDGQIDNAFIWDHSKRRYLSLFEEFDDIGEDDRVWLDLGGFNNQGDIVGKRERFYGYRKPSIFEASIWNLDADKTTISLSPEFANDSEDTINDINDLRQVVGSYEKRVSNEEYNAFWEQHGFEKNDRYATIWDEQKGLQNLNNLIDPSLGWLLINALSINNQGQIVGMGKKEGKTAGFLLLPISK